MRKLCFVLAFGLMSSFVFANITMKKNLKSEAFKIENAINNSYQIKSNIIAQFFDHCTITVSIYQDGELVASGTWTDNTGDCDKALRHARTLAYIELDLATL